MAGGKIYENVCVCVNNMFIILYFIYCLMLKNRPKKNRKTTSAYKNKDIAKIMIFKSNLQVRIKWSGKQNKYHQRRTHVKCEVLQVNTHTHTHPKKNEKKTDWMWNSLDFGLTCNLMIEYIWKRNNLHGFDVNSITQFFFYLKPWKIMCACAWCVLAMIKFTYTIKSTEWKSLQFNLYWYIWIFFAI